MRPLRKLRDPEAIHRLLARSPKNEIILRNPEFFLGEKYTVDSPGERGFLTSWFPSLPGPAWDRLLEGVDHIAQGGRRPMQADVVLTGDCHCKCWHCFRSRHTDRSHLGIEHVARFLSAARELGTVCVGLTGGEPLLRDDLQEIFQAIPEGMEAQLYTTGHGVTEAFVSRMEKTRVTRCLVSLDHYDEHKANARRAYDDAFREATEAVALFSQSDIYTAVSVCVTNDLLEPEELVRYFDFASHLGADEIRVLLPIPQGNLSGRNDKLLYVKAMRTLRELRAETLDDLDYPTILLFCEYENAGCFGCGAGSNYVSLNNDGNVTPCVAVPLTFGNIKTQRFEDIYRNMAEHFRNSGRTCYGRRVAASMREAGSERVSLPLAQDVSRAIAAENVVDGEIGDFFAPFRRFPGREVAC
jgi:MoaA/NifB/PqqE/SkfB family radical SAM enzyme